MPRHTGLWVVAGALCSVGLLAIGSVGLPLLVVGATMIVVLVQRGAVAPWALLAGASLAVAGLGIVDLADGTPACTSLGVSDPPSPGRPSACESGGIPAEVLLGLGVTGLAAALVGGRLRRQPPATSAPDGEARSLTKAAQRS